MRVVAHMRERENEWGVQRNEEPATYRMGLISKGNDNRHLLIFLISSYYSICVAALRTALQIRSCPVA